MSVTSARAARDRALLARSTPRPDATAVIGPPCSGKTMYAQRRRAAGDMVVDLDALAAACGSPNTHDHLDVHLSAALACRDAIVAHWKRRGGCHLWLIATHRTQLAQLGLMGASVVVLDTPLDVCERRALAAGRSVAVVAAIREWTVAG